MIRVSRQNNPREHIVKVVRLVPAIVRSTAAAGAWLVRHMTQPRTTVEAWMVSRGFDVATRKRWASAVGRKVAQVARTAGVRPVGRERIAIGAGDGWSDAYVYTVTDFGWLMKTAWTSSDAKGRTFADKIG
jgi:hypothetical protein